MFPQIPELKAELDADPEALGYAALGWNPAGSEPTNAQAKAIADALNETTRSRERQTLSASQILEAIDLTEYRAIPVDQRDEVRLVLTLGDQIQIGPGTKARAWLLDAFGGGTATRAALVAAATESISRATELGWGQVKPGNVQEAWRYA